MSEQTTTPFLSDRTYNALKWISQIFLPALGALYFSLSEIWGLPHGTEIVGTITVIDLFVGAVLRISTRQYNNSEDRFDGVVDVNDTTKTAVLRANSGSLLAGDQVTFRINRVQTAEPDA